jgi:CRISPR-associated protein Cas2
MSYLLALYDIPDDKLRARVADLLQDRGLARIQRSVYLGRASPGRRDLIIQELTELVGQQAARIHLIPLAAEDVDDILSIRTKPIPRKPRAATP